MHTTWTTTLRTGQHLRSYTYCYDTRRHNPVWVAYPHHRCYMEGSGRTTPDPWGPDPALEESSQAKIYPSYPGDTYNYWMADWMTGGFGLNITNNAAAQFYAEQGLSSLLILPEVKDSDIASIAPARNGKPVPTGVMIYGHMPLMLTRACPLQNIHDCAHCDKTGVLTDRKAKKFPVRCGLGVRTIYNPVPIYMGDKPGALAVDYGVAYFTLETREEAAAILDMIRTHAPFEGDFTRGLYFKGTN